MTKGKNKKIFKKDNKKKNLDKHPFMKKEWFKVMSPKAVGSIEQVGWTPVKKPTGTQKIQDLLQGRVLEICLADVKKNKFDIQNVSKKIQVSVEEVQGDRVTTSFYKFELTRDQVQKNLRKRQSLVDVFTNVKSKDGNQLRVFVQIVSQRVQGQVRLNSYLVDSKIKEIRKNVVAFLINEAAGLSSDEFVNKLIYNKYDQQIVDTYKHIAPNTLMQVIKVKMVKKDFYDEVKPIDYTPKESKTQA